VLQILGFLRDHQRATVGHLMGESNRSRNGVQGQLDLLVHLEVVRVEYGPIEGSFRPGNWYVLVPERLEQLAWEVFEQLGGT
jgi:hypothetical protein